MTKNELKRIRSIDDRIESKLRQLEELKSDKYSVKGIDYSKDRIQGDKAQGDDKLISIMELEREINADIDALIDLKRRCLKSIRKVQGAEGVILEMRYVENMTFEEISYRLDKSIQHVYRIHGHALQIISKF